MNTLEKLIQKYPNKPWGWAAISENPNITLEFIEKNSSKPWNWYYISLNPNITMEIIEKNTDKPWDWCGISRNPNITIDFNNQSYQPILVCGNHNLSMRSFLDG